MSGLRPFTEPRISWCGDAMKYAKAHVAIGVLSVDGNGHVWRNAKWRTDRWVAVVPRRAENGSRKGYLRVTIGIPGGGLAQVMAHRLVYEVLVGVIPDCLQINHKNLIRNDNTPSNLEIVTGSENVKHAYRHGRMKPWAMAPTWRGRRRVSPDEISEAREMRNAGMVSREIAERLGISVRYAHDIARRVIE